MLDLKTIIEKYPRNVGTRTQLASLLHDLYPTEKREVNVALAVYDSGIASRIAGLKSLNTVLLRSFTKQLVDEYGLQEQFATEGIEAWAKAYGFPVEKGSTDTPCVIPQKNITHNPNAYAQPGVVNGSASNYELEHTFGGYIISKFRGFDEADVVVPNTIDGKTIVGIGKEAYFACAAMQSLVISDGIKFIENGAFAKCENLSNVIFPATLIRIGSFEQPNSMFSSSLAPKGAFAYSGIVKAILPEGLQTLGAGTFLGCPKLESIDIPNGIMEIKNSTFSGCRSLLKMILPEHLSKIGSESFYGCTKLKDIQFPLSLIAIESNAFKKCSSLVAVALNEGLKKIGSSAFNDCTSLSKILLPSTVSDIQESISGDLFSINSWYQPHDRRKKGWWTHSKNPKLTIYCYAGSYGLEYARKKEYPIQNAVYFTN